MAGIGFELRKLISKGRFIGLFSAFGYSYILSSGPVIISILSIIYTGFIYYNLFGDSVRQFQVVVTHIIAYTLIVSGLYQLMFTRYVADRLFEEQKEKVVPNLNGVLIVVSSILFIFSFLYSIVFLEDLKFPFSLIFISTSIITGMNWILNTLLSGLKNYKWIFISFGLSYALVFILAYPLGKLLNIDGLILSFTLGQSVLFVMLYSRVLIEYSYTRLVDFEFLSRKKSFYSLAFTGFFYNLALWIDKFVFWYSPLTGQQVLGPFYASVVYDIPIFLAYLSITPAIAIMTILLEGYFSREYEEYYSMVVKGGRLGKLYEKAIKMAELAKDTIIYTLIFQIGFNALILSFAEDLFSLFNLPLTYIPLFRIQLVGTTLQVCFVIVLALLFYFDKRSEAAILSFVYFLSNLLISFLTIKIGPYYYGYGFAISSLISLILGIIYLKQFLERIHYETFALRR